MAARGWALVYGGGNTGSMGAVAKGVKAGGGRVVGIIPEFMKAKELAFAEADELVTVETMRDRKRMMEERADAFLTLPGGWGTLEEILEILVLRQLDRTRKPCVILNQGGFYDDLLKLFERMVAERFNKPGNLGLYTAVTDIPGAMEALAAPSLVADTKWFVTGEEKER